VGWQTTRSATLDLPERCKSAVHRILEQTSRSRHSRERWDWLWFDDHHCDDPRAATWFLAKHWLDVLPFARGLVDAVPWRPGAIRIPKKENVSVVLGANHKKNTSRNSRRSRRFSQRVVREALVNPCDPRPLTERNRVQSVPPHSHRHGEHPSAAFLWTQF
jgi:hypothetical protein